MLKHFSGWIEKMDSVCSLLSRVLLFATPWNAPLSMEFARQEYWSGLPFPSSEVLSDLGIRLVSSALQADYLLSEQQGNLPKGRIQSNVLCSHVQLFETHMYWACQAPLSMGLSRQECWNGLPFSSPRGLPNSGIEPSSSELKADSLPYEQLSDKIIVANLNNQMKYISQNSKQNIQNWKSKGKKQECGDLTN